MHGHAWSSKTRGHNNHLYYAGLFQGARQNPRRVPLAHTEPLQYWAPLKDIANQEKQFIGQYPDYYTVQPQSSITNLNVSCMNLYCNFRSLFALRDLDSQQSIPLTRNLSLDARSSSTSNTYLTGTDELGLTNEFFMCLK